MSSLSKGAVCHAGQSAVLPAQSKRQTGLSRLNVSNCNRCQLYRYLRFYRLYPRIVGTLPPQLPLLISSGSDQGKCLIWHMNAFQSGGFGALEGHWGH